MLIEERRGTCRYASFLILPGQWTQRSVFVNIAGRGEDRFEHMLEEEDFAVMRVPEHALHEEYRDGQYRVLRVCKRGG
jgi:hypothetical protein